MHGPEELSPTIVAFPPKARSTLHSLYRSWCLVIYNVSFRKAPQSLFELYIVTARERAKSICKYMTAIADADNEAVGSGQYAFEPLDV